MLRGTAGRRYVAVLCAALALPVTLTACLGKAAPSAPIPVPTDGRPNIVFVLTDDLSMDLLQYMPHVRALQQEGTSFSNYYVVDSLCCPSRAAIFTGRYPHNDGVWTNHPPQGGYEAYNKNDDQAKSFAVALKNAGYYTGFMGKYLNGYEPTDPPAPGWDQWVGAGKAYSEYDYQLNDNGELETYGESPHDYLTNVLAGNAVSFIHRSQFTGKPFALEVATFAPHVPSTPAPIDSQSFPNLVAPRSPAFGVPSTDAPAWLAGLPGLSATDIETIDNQYRKRAASVLAVDRMIGEIERALEATGKLSNTYIVFSSDNGYHMGEHDLMPGKQTAFDTDIRVPLIVSGPGVVAGRTVDAMTSSIDLAPTFTQIAHAQPAAEQDGVGLLDIWHGESVPADWQRAVLIEHHGPVDSSVDPDAQSYRSGHPPNYEAMRTATALYVEYVTGQREYYDLTTDPFELHNVYGSLSAKQQLSLQEKLASLSFCHGAPECQRAATPTDLG
jgi:arylsulfatase A-like enzyme